MISVMSNGKVSVSGDNLLFWHGNGPFHFTERRRFFTQNIEQAYGPPYAGAPYLTYHFTILIYEKQNNNKNNVSSLSRIK